MTSGKQLIDITEDENRQIAPKTFINGLNLINLLVRGDSVSLENNSEIILATGVAGILETWTNDQYLKTYIASDGTVTLLFGSANTAITDSGVNLCVYKSGTGARIKNRLGSTNVVRFKYNYS
jgi:hypothetical protein